MPQSTQLVVAYNEILHPFGLTKYNPNGPDTHQISKQTNETNQNTTTKQKACLTISRTANPLPGVETMI